MNPGSSTAVRRRPSIWVKSQGTFPIWPEQFGHSKRRRNESSTHVRNCEASAVCGRHLPQRKGSGFQRGDQVSPDHPEGFPGIPSVHGKAAGPSSDQGRGASLDLLMLSEHFSLEELTASEVAARAGIDNTPSAETMRNLLRLAVRLELVRAARNELLTIANAATVCELGLRS